MRGDARVERTRPSASRRPEALPRLFYEDLSCAKFRKSSQFFGVRQKIVSDFLTERRTEAEKNKEGERERERDVGQRWRRGRLRVRKRPVPRQAVPRLVLRCA